MCIFVALDFDGVITKLEVDWNEVKSKVSELLGYKVDSLFEILLKTWNTPLYREISRLIESYELKAIEKARPHDYIRYVLDEFSRKVSGIFLVTMQSLNVINIFLDRYELKGYFTRILTRDDFPCKKMQIQYIIDNLGIESSRLYLIDDLPRNCEICLELGCKCILIGKESDKFLCAQNLLDALNLIIRYLEDVC